MQSMTDGRMHIQTDSRPDAGLYLQALQTETTQVLITEDWFDASKHVSLDYGICKVFAI